MTQPKLPPFPPVSPRPGDPADHPVTAPSEPPAPSPVPDLPTKTTEVRSDPSDPASVLYRILTPVKPVRRLPPVRQRITTHESPDGALYKVLHGGPDSLTPTDVTALLTAKALPPIPALRRALRYSPTTGALRWRLDPENHKNTHNKGKRAGTVMADGRRRVVFLGHAYTAARIIIALQRGFWPTGRVYHLNGDPSDTRWNNLSLCPPKQRLQSELSRKK